MKKEMIIGVIMLMIFSVLLAGCGAGEKAGKATEAVCISLWDDYESKCGDPCVESTFEECPEMFRKYSGECPYECKEPEVLADTKESEDIKEASNIAANGSTAVAVPGAITPKEDLESALEKPTNTVAVVNENVGLEPVPLETIERSKACALCATGAVLATHCEDDHYWEEVYDGTQDSVTCDCGTEATQQLPCETVFPGSAGCLDMTQCS